MDRKIDKWKLKSKVHNQFDDIFSELLSDKLTAKK